jgi:exopolysaccharide production protein ExoQ
MAVLAALGLIIAADSMTSFVTLLGMMLVLLFASTLRWNSRIRNVVQVLGCVIALPFLYLLVHNRAAVTEMLGRNGSLSGRVKIWELSISSIAIKPILGYGFSAFWRVSAEAMRISAGLNWEVPHAHNAYIELTLELGLVGLGLYALAYLVALRRAAVYIRTNRENSAKWPLAYLCFGILYSFTESSMLASNSVLWMLFVAAACSVTQPAGAFAFAGADDSEAAADPGTSFATSQDYA